MSMKTVYRKIICFVFVFGLIVAFNDIRVSAATLCTVDEAMVWVKAQEGKAYDYDGVYGAQCVDLIQGYYNYLGVPVSSGHGYQYATNSLPTSYGWQRIKGAVPQKGDILIYDKHSGNQYGHVAIYEDETVVWHGKLNGVGKVQKTTKKRYDAFANYWGVIRPKFANSNIPKGCLDSANGGMNRISLSGWVFDRDDVSETIEIHVYIDGTCSTGTYVGALVANQLRKDVNDAYTGVGDYHGFSGEVYVPAGTHSVYVYAINIGAGSENPLIGYRTNVVVEEDISTSKFSSSGEVTRLAEDSWLITAKLDNTYVVKECGFYIGISPSDMIRVSENTNINTKILQYSLGSGSKWYETLNQNTRYYYRFFVVFDGIEYKGELCDFSTGTKNELVQGCLEKVEGKADKIEVSGWAFDWNDPTRSVEVSISVYDELTGNKVYSGDLKADQMREDVNFVYPGIGRFHGYKADIPITDEGTYSIIVYAVDEDIKDGLAGYYIKINKIEGISVYRDRVSPIISNVKVTNISEEGYTVTCTVTDNVEVAKVQFPTWTAVNGQDDLASDWWNNTSIRGTVNGSQVTFRVNTSEHNGEVGVYRTHIYAIDSSENSVCYEIPDIVIEKAPVLQAPKTLSAELYGYDDVKLSWSKSTDADGYNIYYKKSTASKYTKLASTTSLTYKKNDLADGTKYAFKIVPYYLSNGQKVESANSKAISIYTLKKLDAPKIAKASSTQVKVSWSDISGESGYQLSVADSKTKTNIVSTTTAVSKTRNATKNKTYYYKVRAYRTVDGKKIYGPWSDVKGYNLRNVSALSGLKANLYGHDDVKLSWKKSTGANQYRIYYKKSSDKSYTYLTKTTKNTYSKANLTDGAKYTFKVVPCYTVDGEVVAQGTSKTVSIYTLKKLNAPKISKVSSSQVKVTWNNISGESGYQISRSASKTKTENVVTVTTTKGTSKNISVTKGKTYYYKVRAYKTVDGKKIYSPWSAVTSYKLK